MEVAALSSLARARKVCHAATGRPWRCASLDCNWPFCGCGNSADLPSTSFKKLRFGEQSRRPGTVVPTEIAPRTAAPAEIVHSRT
jgi:hypothetical protein